MVIANILLEKYEYRARIYLTTFIDKPLVAF